MKNLSLLFSHISYYGYMSCVPFLVILTAYHAITKMNLFAGVMVIIFLIVFIVSIKHIKKQYRDDLQHFKAGE